MSRRKRPMSVTAIGWFWLITGWLFCAGSVSVVLALLLTEGRGIVGDLLRPPRIAVAVSCAVGIIGLVSGWGLLKLKEWARRTLRVLTALCIAAVAAIGLFGLDMWGLPGGNEPADVIIARFGATVALFVALVCGFGVVYQCLGSGGMKTAMRGPGDQGGLPPEGRPPQEAEGARKSRAPWIAALPPTIALTAVLVAMAIALPQAPRTKEQYERLQHQMFVAIALLAEENIERVTVFDHWYGAAEPLHVVADAERVGRFATALREATPWTPNQPHFRRTCYVVVELRDDVSLEYRIGLKRDDVAYIYFVAKQDDSLSHFGHAQSRPLFQWLQEVGVR